MSAVPALGHEALLTLAHKVHAAAVDGDRERLDRATRQFMEALVDHLDDEAPRIGEMAPPEARMLRRGQRRLLAKAHAFIEESAANCEGGVTDCSAQAEWLLALLVLQAGDERRLLPDVAA